MKFIKNNKKFFLGILVGIIMCGSIVFASNNIFYAKDIKFTPDKSSWDVTNVEDAINDLFNLNTTLIDSKYTFDTNKSIISYTAPKAMTVLVIGVGSSTYCEGSTTVSIESTGSIEKIVENKYLTVPSHVTYSSTYAYKVILDEGDTLNFSLWSNQGNTSNTAMLFSIN